MLQKKDKYLTEISDYSETLLEKLKQWNNAYKQFTGTICCILPVLLRTVSE